VPVKGAAFDPGFPSGALYAEFAYGDFVKP
jgi:hypothetical protein